MLVTIGGYDAAPGSGGHDVLMVEPIQLCAASECQVAPVYPACDSCRRSLELQFQVVSVKRWSKHALEAHNLPGLFDRGRLRSRGTGSDGRTTDSATGQRCCTWGS